MKAGTRLVAIASGPIQGRKRALLVGIVAQKNTVEGVISGSVAVNGDDATRRIISMVGKTRFKEQIGLVVLNGVAIAGLNVVDVEKLEKAMGVETIILTRTRPDPRKLIHALNSFAKKDNVDVKGRVALVRAQAKRKTEKASGFRLQSLMSKHDLAVFATQSYEMIRVAHLVANGVSTGESRGRI